jgi:hypothetical protein
MCSGYIGWLGRVYDWQTLIAGGLALFAGVVTVWGTLRAAKRQVKAANDAADREIKAASDTANRQITAAQEQTAAAQHQTGVMRDMERRRIAREGYAFYAMLEAAMGAVIDDAQAARQLFPGTPGPDTPQAFRARQRIKRAGFTELRGAFLRIGGPLTEKFLRLDTEIANFAEQWMDVAVNTSHNLARLGAHAGFSEQLDRIEQQATALREEATKRCRDELVKETRI